MTYVLQEKNQESAATGWWLALRFLALLLVNTIHHQPWSDGLHAWAIVVNSPNLATVFGILHYEGHPGLWHLLLWLGSNLSGDPAVMTWTHFILAALSIVIVAK